MSVDAFARLTSAKVADLASSAPGKGASLVSLPNGGTLGDLGNGYRDAVFATAHGGVELACAQAVAAGKSRVIVNGLAWVATGTVTTFAVMIEFMGGATLSANGFALNFAKGFRANDTDAIFAPADARLLTFPVTQRLTPFHFGAKADYVSPAAPGTDNADALNAWAGELCWRVMPPGKYGTTRTIHWNGDAVAASTSGVRAEVGAEIIQRTDNIPVMTFYGTRSEWRFPRLSFMNAQPSTNYGAVCLLCTVNPGQGSGLYMSSVPYLHTYQGAVGVFFPGAINSSLALAAAAAATTVKVANAQTDLNAAYPWLPGMYVQIALDAGGYHTTRIVGVATDVLTLRDPMPSAAAIGKRVAVAPNKLVNASDLGTNPVRFSNTWGQVFIENPSRWGWVDRGSGTQDSFVNRYVTCTTAFADISSPPLTLVSAIHETFRNGDKHGITNIEHFNFTGDAWYIGADNVVLGSVHFEACRLKTDGTGLIAGAVQSLQIDVVQVVYCTMLSSDITTSCGLFTPRSTASTGLGGNRGIWRIDNLHTSKNIVNASVAFLVRDASSNQTKLEIGNWQCGRDGGFYPTGQLSFPANYSGLVRLGNLIPEQTVSFRFDADLTVTTAQDMYTSNKGQYRVGKVAYLSPSKAITTATAGVWNESGATNLVSSSGTSALTALSNKTAVVEPGLHANEAGKLRNAGARLYFKCGTAEAAPSAVIGTSSYLTGRNGGSNNTNLGFVNFAAAHGFNTGDVVAISGSVNASLNGTFKVVDVPSATQLAIYVDSASSVGSFGAPIADPAISVQLRPTLHVVALGDDYGF
ncbi:hypothetical protein NSE01_14770 [Novosphingobium sediminis]|uniref:Uncharacterized protein n=1 Tax=Novosphingobium sediminis TaxID=707214 RepID=A0A512AIW2_9SPHN|nr:hypothetical protein [Novosphingobium sediminis]GEN99644.1 hypothetical protein NSE01_14770 [Novosphingobium sediminis]